MQLDPTIQEMLNRVSKLAKVAKKMYVEHKKGEHQRLDNKLNILKLKSKIATQRRIIRKSRSPITKNLGIDFNTFGVGKKRKNNGNL